MNRDPLDNIAAGASKAIIVGVFLPDENESLQTDSLAELSALLQTLGVAVAGKLVQRRQRLTAKCLLGSGKVQEITEACNQAEADLVVFDRALSPPQVRNLEQMTGRQVLDRAGVILEIFAKHARSNQAKTQVEIARLEYLLPRLTGAWTHFQRQSGGGVSRGMGEKQIEIDRRRARERIARLNKHLKSIDKEQQTQRKARSNELKVALVGYTNSGKTTIMHGMTRSETQGRDVLFATLDASVRTIDPNTRPKILLSDTVGFIRNLPHGLIDTFKSTLAGVVEAELLLHVVDLSHENYQAQMETTEQVLGEIGAADIPRINVFNKIDQLDDVFLPRILKQAYPGSVFINAHNAEDIRKLRGEIYAFFERTFVRAKLRVPLADSAAMAVVYQSGVVLEVNYDHEAATFDLRMPAVRLLKVRQYIVDAREHLGQLNHNVENK
jgi:GTP-binding protein HflX